MLTTAPASSPQVSGSRSVSESATTSASAAAAAAAAAVSKKLGTYFPTRRKPIPGGAPAPSAAGLATGSGSPDLEGDGALSMALTTALATAEGDGGGGASPEGAPSRALGAEGAPGGAPSAAEGARDGAPSAVEGASPLSCESGEDSPKFGRHRIGAAVHDSDIQTVLETISPGLSRWGSVRDRWLAADDETAPPPSVVAPNTAPAPAGASTVGAGGIGDGCTSTAAAAAGCTSTAAAAAGVALAAARPTQRQLSRHRRTGATSGAPTTARPPAMASLLRRLPSLSEIVAQISPESPRPELDSAASAELAAKLRIENSHGLLQIQIISFHASHGTLRVAAPSEAVPASSGAAAPSEAVPASSGAAAPSEAVPASSGAAAPSEAVPASSGAAAEDAAPAALPTASVPLGVRVEAIGQSVDTCSAAGTPDSAHKLPCPCMQTLITAPWPPHRYTGLGRSRRGVVVAVCALDVVERAAHVCAVGDPAPIQAHLARRGHWA